MDLHFTVVKLWELPVEDWLASGDSAALIFTPLLKGATIATLGVAAEQLRQLPNDAERDNALNYLIMFAVRKFGEQMVATYLKENAMLDQIMLESEWYNIVLKRGAQQGEKGLALRLAYRSIEKYHAPLTDDVRDALEQADEAVLEEIVVNAATDTIEQVRERLALPTQ